MAVTVTVPDDDDDGETTEQLTPFVRRVALIAALSGLLFGYDSGVIASALVSIHSDIDGRELTLGEEELIVAGLTLGALFGAVLASWTSDRFGRKRTIIAAAVLFTLGAIEQAAAQLVKELVLGRVIVGLGVGLASMVTPVYLAELTPSVWRGRVVSLLTVCITLGQVVAYIVGASLYGVESGWRWMLLSGAVPSIAQLVLSFAMPDSPRWQVQKGRTEQARATLARIYPTVDAQGIEAKIAAIERTLDSADKQTIHLGASRSSVQTFVDAVWRDLPTRRALFVACALQAIQQLTGFNALMYFSARFLRSAGFSRPAVAALPIAISNFIGTLVSLRLIDRLGRRPMLKRSLIGMTLGHIFIGFAFIFVSSDGSASFAAWLTLLAMIAFCTSYACVALSLCSYAQRLGVGNVPWCVQSEIFDLHVRSIGNGLATASNWLSNLLAAGA